MYGSSSEERGFSHLCPVGVRLHLHHNRQGQEELGSQIENNALSLLLSSRLYLMGLFNVREKKSRCGFQNKKQIQESTIQD